MVFEFTILLVLVLVLERLPAGDRHVQRFEDE